MDRLRKIREEAVEAVRQQAERDPTRPVFHFRPQANWMNDVCAAFVHSGWYHIFYQSTPLQDTAPMDYGWGHARSRDLVSWEILPEALIPDRDKGEFGYGSGSAMLTDDGEPVLYFAWTPVGVWEKRAKREQRAALPLDEGLINWRKVEIGMKPGENGVPADIPGSWADMFVFRAEGRVFAVFKASDGLLCEARNPELTDWQAVGRIEGISGECPNLFPLDGKFVLLQSTYPISYQIGKFDAAAFRFIPHTPHRTMDCGYGPEKPHNHARGIYGTTITTDENGRTLLFGWVSGFQPGRGWNGCAGLPRELTIDAEGYLIQMPARELRRLRGAHMPWETFRLEDASRELTESAGGTWEIKVAVRPDGCGNCGLRLARGQDRVADILIDLDGDVLNVAGTELPDVLGEDRVVDLHLFLDRSVLEVFVNGGRQTVTKVVQAEPVEVQPQVFAEGGPAEFGGLDAWRVDSIWG